jgi:hypothetical protein
MAWEEFFLCSDIPDSELPWNTSDCLETPATSPVGSLQDTFSLGLDGGAHIGVCIGLVNTFQHQMLNTGTRNLGPF